MRSKSVLVDVAIVIVALVLTVLVSVLVLATTVFGGAERRAPPRVAITLNYTVVRVTHVVRPQGVCPYKVGPNTSKVDVLNLMNNKVLDCFKPTSTQLQQILAIGTDAYRPLILSACQLVEPALRACVGSFDGDAPICLNEETHRLWITSLALTDTWIKAICDDGGEEIAHILADEFKHMTKGYQKRALFCETTFAKRTGPSMWTDLSAFTVSRYHALEDARKCIVNVAKKGGTSSKQFEHFMDKLIESVDCLSPPPHYAMIPCSRLVAADPFDYLEEQQLTTPR